MKNKNVKSIQDMNKQQDLVSKLAQKNVKGGIGCPPPLGVKN